MERRAIRNIVFDLGGVLIDLDRQRCIDAFTALGFPADRAHARLLPPRRDLQPLGTGRCHRGRDLRCDSTRGGESDPDRPAAVRRLLRLPHRNSGGEAALRTAAARSGLPHLRPFEHQRNGMAHGRRRLLPRRRTRCRPLFRTALPLVPHGCAGNPMPKSSNR